MGNLSVRKLDEETIHKLRVRAASHGVSMEEEARQIIRQAVSAPDRLADVITKHFGKRQGVELTPSAENPHKPILFEK